MGKASNGLPVALQLATTHRAERILYRIAYAFEAARLSESASNE
jgi:Asp-tRNA(Asn)/Glu-tRNA(Gln) amidotransferase A subunit family amidase